MKDGIRSIVGKTIVSVVVGRNERSPKHQVMLVFDDGTYFEIWGNDVHGAGGVDPGGVGEVEAYVSRSGGVVVERYPGTPETGQLPKSSAGTNSL